MSTSSNDSQTVNYVSHDDTVLCIIKNPYWMEYNHCMRVSINASVGRMKQKIQATYPASPPFGRQRLIYQGRCLMDGQKVMDIVKGSLQRRRADSSSQTDRQLSVASEMCNRLVRSGVLRPLRNGTKGKERAAFLQDVLRAAPVDAVPSSLQHDPLQSMCVGETSAGIPVVRDQQVFVFHMALKGENASTYWEKWKIAESEEDRASQFSTILASAIETPSDNAEAAQFSTTDDTSDLPLAHVVFLSSLDMYAGDEIPQNDPVERKHADPVQHVKAERAAQTGVRSEDIPQPVVHDTQQSVDAAGSDGDMSSSASSDASSTGTSSTDSDSSSTSSPSSSGRRRRRHRAHRSPYAQPWGHPLRGPLHFPNVHSYWPSGYPVSPPWGGLSPAVQGAAPRIPIPVERWTSIVRDLTEAPASTANVPAAHTPVTPQTPSIPNGAHPTGAGQSLAVFARAAPPASTPSPAVAPPVTAGTVPSQAVQDTGSESSRRAACLAEIQQLEALQRRVNAVAQAVPGAMHTAPMSMVQQHAWPWPMYAPPPMYPQDFSSSSDTSSSDVSSSSSSDASSKYKKRTSRRLVPSQLRLISQQRKSRRSAGNREGTKRRRKPRRRKQRRSCDPPAAADSADPVERDQANAVDDDPAAQAEAENERIARQLAVQENLRVVLALANPFHVLRMVFRVCILFVLVSNPLEWFFGSGKEEGWDGEDHAANYVASDAQGDARGVRDKMSQVANRFMDLPTVTVAWIIILVTFSMIMHLYETGVLQMLIRVGRERGWCCCRRAAAVPPQEAVNEDPPAPVDAPPIDEADAPENANQPPPPPPGGAAFHLYQFIKGVIASLFPSWQPNEIPPPPEETEQPPAPEEDNENDPNAPEANRPIHLNDNDAVPDPVPA